MKSYFLAFICLSQITLFAQIDSNSRTIKEAAVSYDETTTQSQKVMPEEEGKLHIEKDENIDLLIQDYVDNKKFIGYRIQLFAGNSRLEAIKVKSDFLLKYENNYPEVIYQAPNFKVRVGNFRDRLEANKMLLDYKVNFPSAFIVQDEIHLVNPNKN